MRGCFHPEHSASEHRTAYNKGVGSVSEEALSKRSAKKGGTVLLAFHLHKGKKHETKPPFIREQG